MVQAQPPATPGGGAAPAPAPALAPAPVAALRERMAAAESTLRTSPCTSTMGAHDGAPGNCLFEAQAGRLWSAGEDARAYLRLRADLGLGLIKLHDQSPGGSTRARKQALGHLLAVLKLNRGDDLGVRDIVPCLMIGLGDYQAAYDFIKWWLIAHGNPGRNWADMSLEYMDCSGENAAEDAEAWLGPPGAAYLPLPLLLDLALIKVALATCAGEGKGGIPADWRSEGPMSIMAEERAVVALGRVHAMNAHVLGVIVDPPDDLMRITGFQLGGRDEAKLVLQRSGCLALWTGKRTDFLRRHMPAIPRA